MTATDKVKTFVDELASDYISDDSSTDLNDVDVFIEALTTDFSDLLRDALECEVRSVEEARDEKLVDALEIYLEEEGGSADGARNVLAKVAERATRRGAQYQFGNPA